MGECITMEFGWEDWQLNTLDDYILGYTIFETQQQLANYLDKNLNSVKIKLSRRKKEIEENKRELTNDEYLIILANRFSKDTNEVAEMLNLSSGFLLEELDGLDCLECKEYLQEGFHKRPILNEEYEIFVKLYSVKKLNKINIAHILNRSAAFIEELIKDYERI